MTMVLNEEQRYLKSTINQMLQEHAPVSSLPTLRNSNDELGYASSFWLHLVEMGMPSIIMSPGSGGLGFGFTGLGTVLEEMGRTLAASPLFATVVLGGSALELAGGALQEDLLPEIMAGKLTLALAIDEGHHHQPLACATSLTRVNNELVLDGTKVFVLDGHSADRLVVVARSAGAPGDEHGLSLILIPRETEGVHVQRTILMDGRNAAKIQFNTVKLDSNALVGTLHDGWPVLKQILDRGAICMAKALSNQCYAHITNEAVQMHGGMGITDELDIGLYLKRARVSMQILGDTSYHQDRYAQLMGY